MSLFTQKELIRKKLKLMFLENQDFQNAIHYTCKDYKLQPHLDNPYILFEGNPTLGEDGQKILPSIFFSSRVFDVVKDAKVILKIEMFEKPIFGIVNSMKLNIMFTLLVHHNCLITEYSESRIDEIFDMIDNRINGNVFLSNGFRVVGKGTRVLNDQSEYSVTRSIYEVIIPFANSNVKYKNSDKFDV